MWTVFPPLLLSKPGTEEPLLSLKDAVEEEAAVVNAAAVELLLLAFKPTSELAGATT